MLVGLLKHSLLDVVDTSAQALLDIVKATPLPALKTTLDTHAIQTIAQLVQHAKPRLVDLSVRILIALAHEEHFQSAIAEQGCLAALVARLRLSNVEAVEAACTALSSLATHPKLKTRIGELNATQLLVQKLKSGDEGVLTMCSSCFSVFAARPV